MLNWYYGAQSLPRKYPPHHYTTTSLNRWDKAGWIHAFMFFRPNYDPTWMSQQKSNSSDQAPFLQSSIVQFWWSCVNCILRVLFLADRSGTRCGLLLLAHLLQGSTCCVFRDGILQILVVTSGYLSYCCFLSSLTSLSILLWPLTSTRHFRPHNCRSLDIFSFSDHSL